MWTRRELKQKAKEALKRNYWKTVLVALFLIILGDGFSPATAAGGGNNSYSSRNEIQESTYEIITEVGTDTISRSIASSVVNRLQQVDPVVIAAAAVAMTAFILIVIVGIMVVEMLLINPLIVGAKRFMLKCVEDKGDIAEVGYAFDHSYLNCVKAMFFREMYIFLWALLFVIPGIYKKYQYYMVEYILARNPEMPYKEVLELSTQMMQGHKWNTFVLDLSFILWHMLGVVTCGIVEVFYVQPYAQLTRASLYYELNGGLRCPTKF